MSTTAHADLLVDEPALPVRKARALQQRVEQRKQQAPVTSVTAPKVQQGEAPPNGRRGAASREIVRKAERQLVQQEQLGLFSVALLRPGNEIPTLLARLPIFPAIARSRHRALLDRDNAYPFVTPYGRGRRHGPPVDVEDEDVLIALMRLRQRRVAGPGRHLPVPLVTLQQDNIHVHVVCGTVSQILDEMGLTDAGLNYQRVMDSLKRLSAVMVEVEVTQQTKYFGTATTGKTHRLVEIEWAMFESEGYILAQFSPIVSAWLENQVSYLDWKIRRQLNSRNARAVHRFLSTQNKVYENQIERIAETVGWEGDKRRMRTGFEAILKQLQELDWLEEWTITGTGRKIPYRLYIKRR